MANLAWNMPESMQPGLEESHFFDPPNFTFPFGTHICVVEVDPETGEVKIDRYVAVDDIGTVINPMIVDGQVHGGVAQGIGQALYEGAVYDESGQLLTGSMMDYAVPNATHIPDIETYRTVTPTPVNPLGAKGVGETGTIASTEAVVNAVVDALAPFGIRHLEMPMTPERIWRAIEEAKQHIAARGEHVPGYPAGPHHQPTYPPPGEAGVPIQQMPSHAQEAEPFEGQGLIEDMRDEGKAPGQSQIETEGHTHGQHPAPGVGDQGGQGNK
jgi:hypothetical protein